MNAGFFDEEHWLRLVMINHGIAVSGKRSLSEKEKFVLARMKKNPSDLNILIQRALEWDIIDRERFDWSDWE